MADRLHPFEVELTRVASRTRTDERGPVHGVDGQPDLMPTTDVLVVALPASRGTGGRVDASVLSLQQEGRFDVLAGDSCTGNVYCLTSWDAPSED